MRGAVGLVSGRISWVASRSRRWAAVGAALLVVGMLSVSAASADAYVNPFKEGSWSPGRIDMAST